MRFFHQRFPAGCSDFDLFVKIQNDQSKVDAKFIPININTRLCSLKFQKSAKKTPKIVSPKFFEVQKTQNFMLFHPKISKSKTQIISKKQSKISTFLKCLGNNFLCELFATFLTDLNSAQNSAFLDSPAKVLKTVCHFLPYDGTLNVDTPKTVLKMKKVFSLNFATIRRSALSSC